MTASQRFLSTALTATISLVVTVTHLSAADFVEWTETRDWLLSVGAAPVPDIEEKTNNVGGSTTTEWKKLEGDFSPRLALGYLSCAGGPQGGWTVGIEGVLTTCDVTPAQYQVDGLTFANTSKRTLRYHTAGVLLSGGYQFGIHPPVENISSFLIIAPFVGLGAAYADSEIRDQNGTYDHGNGVGWYVEGGLRAGFFVTERQWLGGFVADLVYSSGEVDVDFTNGSSSSLVHERTGFSASLVVGYRL
jgi:hypothetical protein